MPYIDMTNTNNIPKNTLVLIIANISKPLETLYEKICVTMIIAVTKIKNVKKENTFNVDVIIKNQNENPIVTVSALYLGEDNCILYRIN